MPAHVLALEIHEQVRREELWKGVEIGDRENQGGYVKC